MSLKSPSTGADGARTKKLKMIEGIKFVWAIGFGSDSGLRFFRRLRLSISHFLRAASAVCTALRVEMN
jgi:hypothetical protein